MKTRYLPDQIDAQPGIYILIINLACDQNIRVGALGVFFFHAGLYAYIGSARGPGGLRARLKRHLQPSAQKKKHWHIDYLLQVGEITSLCWSTEGKHTECEWAYKASGTRFPMRFGSSDCSCAGHLVHLTSAPAQKTYPVFKDADQGLQCIDLI